MLTWQQCIMHSKVPHRFKHGRAFWSLIRNSILWITWLDRNAQSFSNENWHALKTQIQLWDATMDLGRIAWLQVASQYKAHHRLTTKYIWEFDKIWLRTEFFGHRTHMQVAWPPCRPTPGHFV
jgi:hypothetical protein